MLNALLLSTLSPQYAFVFDDRHLLFSNLKTFVFSLMHVYLLIFIFNILLQKCKPTVSISIKVLIKTYTQVVIRFGNFKETYLSVNSIMLDSASKKI